jgi:hypothetical protein
VTDNCNFEAIKNMSTKPVKFKPSDKVLQLLKSKYFSPLSYVDIPTISMDEARNLGLDSGVEVYEIGSFTLTKSSHLLWGSYYKVEILKVDLDLDGKHTEENKTLLNYLQGEFRRQNFIIKATDLRDFNVNTKRSDIIVGNFKLTESIVGGINSLLDGKVEKSYDLRLADKRFGADNKIVNEKITFKEIQRVLNAFVISKDDYNSNGEVAINKLMEAHFQDHFQNASRSGGAKKSFYDLIVGDPENNSGFAIEIKLASSLTNNAGQRQRASGQVKEYVKGLKNTNLILVIIGNKEDYANKNIKALEDEVEKDYNCYFIFHHTN